MTKASSSWAAQVRSICWKPLRLFILVMNRHLAILSSMFSMLGILWVSCWVALFLYGSGLSGWRLLSDFEFFC